MFLVGISCVSAENIDELGTSSSDDVISTDGDVSNTIDNVESDVSTSSVDDEVISDRGSTQEVNSWAGLQSKIEDSSVSIVKLNASNIAPSTSSSDQISINHDITVVGGDGYYIGSADWSSAPKYNYIPMITSGNNLNVRFENVTFQYLSDNILMKLMGNGNYVFKNCIFDHINATGDHQSVIWLNYGYALIDNCTFTNCNCSFGAVTNYYTSWGTAVNNARMTVKDSTFRDNICPGEPGAINNCGYLEVYDSIFEDNRAAWWAGAIHTHSRATTTIVRSSFKNNYAGWYGGALYTYSNLHVINSTFISNMAVSAGYVGGGAIGASNYQGSYPNVVVENSIFKYNTELNFRGGAIAVDGKGNLEVYNSTFVNNSAGNGYGNAISYYYTGSSSSAAYFTYTDNGFYGPNNGSGSIYIYNDKVNVVQSNNNIEDYSSYVEPEENNTNPEGSVVPIPSGTTIGSQLWNSSLSGDLGGTPLVNGERIYVPNGQAIYCLNITNGNLLWNVSSEWGYFHELALHNGVLIAPCAWDKLFMFDAMTGTEIQPTSNMYQASSYYAPAIDGNTIYVSSEHGYGANENLWIAVVEYVNGNYSYTGSILEISGVTNNSNALISAPILWNNYLWVNTINGLVRYDLTANTYITPVVNAVGKPVVGGDYIYVLTADNHICGVNANGNVIKNISVGGNVGSTLAINNANTVLYTVNAEGKIYCADISSSTADAINPQINPVSSALRVGSDGYLYIGDDAGILWVFNSYYSHGNLVSTVLWAYNVTSPIFGELIINNNVYVGTNDTFYDLSRNMAYSSNFDNILNIYNSKLMNDEILSINRNCPISII